MLQSRIVTEHYNQKNKSPILTQSELNQDFLFFAFFLFVVVC
jgi:hypothetical protein